MSFNDFLASLPQHISVDLQARLIEAGPEAVARTLAKGHPDFTRVTVPVLDAQGLISRAKTEIGLTYLNPNLSTWNFIQGEGSKVYEVVTWKPGRDASTAEVRAHFKELGFTGNTPAFIAWVTERQPEGYHVTIPDDDRLWRHPESRHLYAPSFYRADALRELSLHEVLYDWDVFWVFVAFREVPQP